MSVPVNPFGSSASSPGLGHILVTKLPPNKQILQKFDYQYPLKLIAPDPHLAPKDNRTQITLVFLLTYGGGLVGGDKIDLTVTLEAESKLVLVTQGSTKIFKSATPSVVTGQALNVHIKPRAALCYLPDPTQPFAESVFEQKQMFNIQKNTKSSLCVLDWVSEGRRARGESWTLWKWKGRNEVWNEDPETAKRKLLLRDSVTLDAITKGSSNASLLSAKTNNMGVFGTLILHGPVFQSLADHFMHEFSTQPRIGSKNWSDDVTPTEYSLLDKARKWRYEHERRNNILWSAAKNRDFVIVKFGATEIDGARQWLGHILKQDGSIESEFGDQALIGLR